jgi:hypothetical protein
MASADKAAAESIDPAILSAWRRIAADASSPNTPLAAVVRDSLKVGPYRTDATAVAVNVAAVVVATAAALQICVECSIPHTPQTIAQALRLYSPDEMYMSLNGGKDSRRAALCSLPPQPT